MQRGTVRFGPASYLLFSLKPSALQGGSRSFCGSQLLIIAVVRLVFNGLQELGRHAGWPVLPSLRCRILLHFPLLCQMLRPQIRL